MESPDAIAAAAIATNAMWLEIQKSAKVSKMSFSQKEHTWSRPVYYEETA